MRQGLEDDESIRRSVAVGTQRGERKRVRSVIGEIETAVDREVGTLRIAQTFFAGANETGDLVRVRRFAF